MGQLLSHALAGEPVDEFRRLARLGEADRAQASLDESWAWAHVQLAGAPDNGPIADRLGPAFAAANLSRVVCPRNLNPDGADDAGRAWRACLVPAIDAGVKAGLGLEGGTLDHAWTHDGAQPGDRVPLPVYDSWTFRTGPSGDFESLAELLVAVPAPYQVGRRVIARQAKAPRGRQRRRCPSTGG